MTPNSMHSHDGLESRAWAGNPKFVQLWPFAGREKKDYYARIFKVIIYFPKCIQEIPPPLQPSSGKTFTLAQPP